jgi:hypothetical protein
VTFLPIVERELREGSRRRGIFGIQMKIASLGTLAFAVCLLASIADPAISFVKTLFWGMSGVCMLYCLLAGRLTTADCLSREKREGTLGLLFLTDLKGYDVVLGKLAATSLSGFYGLMAIFPMLAIPLLAGGLANAEFWRMTLVLVNTFLFSAAAGLFVSAISRHERKAMGANLGLLLLLAGLPPALFRWWLSCPAYSFWLCADVNFRRAPKDFRESNEIIFGMTIALLLLACWKTPRSWQDTPKPARAPRPKPERPRRRWRAGNATRAALFRKHALDRNGYFWLAARPYFKASSVWMGIAVPAGVWIASYLTLHYVDQAAQVACALILSAMLKLWMASEAGRQIADDKKAGAFELLLSTPLAAPDIVRGQRLALRRQFLLPAAVSVAVGTYFMLSIWSAASRDAALIFCGWAAAILMFVADMIALSWTGMWAGLTSGSHGRATLKTAGKILIVPWAIFGLVDLGARVFMYLFYRPSWDSDWPFDVGCWFCVGILMDVISIIRARRGLNTRFAQLAAEPLTRKRRLAWLRDWRAGTPERKRELRLKLGRAFAVMAAVAAAGAVAVLWDLQLARASVPKPVMVWITQSNNPVRVTVSGQEDQGFLFILPDGTLWSWGRQGAIAPPRQIGTERDWQEVSINRTAGGVRSNGTLWTWAPDIRSAKQFGTALDWASVRVLNDGLLALKRNGSLWNARGPILAKQKWKTVRSSPDFGLFPSEYYGIRVDGTLWEWGSLYCRSAAGWLATNYPDPVQVCKESNWIGFNDTLGEGARNDADESWSLLPLGGLPNAGASITNISTLMSSNGAAGARGWLFTSNWMYARFELRSDGTLWASPWNDPTPWTVWKPAPGPRFRVGERSDWVSIWGSRQTMLGLTADGTLWTWGADNGQESHWVTVFLDRIDSIKRGLAGWGLSFYVPVDDISDESPLQKEPRALMRLAFTNTPAGP